MAGPYVYSNNGMSFRAVDPSYVAQSGEVVFQTIATADQLTAAFSGYAAAAAAATARAAGNAALAAGVQIQSTGTPDLDGTYSLEAAALQNINGTETYILRNSNFPGGASEMPWSDINGGTHIFPDVTTFNNFATAYANYYAAVSLYINSGGVAGSLPAQPVVIP